MDLSIIIVNWNSIKYVEKCLYSIYKNVSNIKYEIIVIDNASFDGCDELIKKNFSNVHFIQSYKNIGFASANNLGFKNSIGEIILFLNPDTEIIDSAIQQMYNLINSSNEIGCVGCKLLNSDMTLQTNCVLPISTLVTEVLNSEFVNNYLYKLNIFKNKYIFTNIKDPVPVEVVNGACIMIDRELFSKIDGFSTDYFMYSEDIDLGFKIRQAGFKTYYLPTAKIIHHGGKSTLSKKNAVFMPVLIRESRMIFFKKTRGLLYAYTYKVLMLTLSIFRLSILILGYPLNQLLVKKKKYKLIILKWFGILKWSIGLESWTKNVSNQAS